MKILLLSSFYLLLSGNPGILKNSTDAQQVILTVENFVKSADQQKVASMDKVLHKDFRATLNRAFGSKEVALMDKSSYLQLLKERKIGGDERVIEIQSVDVFGNNAYVKAKFKGKKLIFQTYLLLVKTLDGKWQVISDMPSIEPVSSKS